MGLFLRSFQFQLKLPNADVFLGQLLFQSPNLILLPEEHSEGLVWTEEGARRVGENK